MFNIFKRRSKDILVSLTNTGLIRENNEDCTTTLKHPQDNNIKLLAVADGVGGSLNGEYASNFVIKNLEKWFLNEDINNFNSSMKISQHLYKTIININNLLYTKEHSKSGCGTTLTCAIVTTDDTIIANIGDSRAYAIIGNEMKQLTKDDSVVWHYYERGQLTKNELRFHYQNCLITKCIGHAYNTKPTIHKISNNKYVGLLLLTDGITDCLSDEKIKFIVDKNNNKNIAKKLIYEAVYGHQNDIVPQGIEFKHIENGKDNASVALYIKQI